MIGWIKCIFLGKGFVLQMNQGKKDDNCTKKATVLLAGQGDEEAFERLLADYTPLITSLVKATLSAFSFPESDYEDLYQEAVILFFRAVSRFDAEQDDVAFGLFAKICIRNGLITQAKKLQKRVDVLADKCAEVAENAADAALPVDDIIERERYSFLYQSVQATLSSYENSVWWRYLAGQTAKSIAKELNTDAKSVQNAIFRIRRKLRAVIPHP